MDSSLLWLWLHSVCRISRAKQYILIGKFGDIESVYLALRDDYESMDIFRREEIDLLCDKDLTKAKDMMSSLSDICASVITIDDIKYPELLKNIHNPPNVLFARGRMFDLNSSLNIAMVGTRKSTKYGDISAFNIAKGLSDAGAVVVSGMALGIDKSSHEGALSGKSPTVAVIASGVDICYPRSNLSLMKKITEKGLILSEYSLGVPAEKYHFPERNRIISGISRGTLVVEADIKSGSLITARCATEQNRDVFAIPGNINSMNSKGSNYLLKDGAQLVTSADDILSYYKYDFTPSESVAKEEKNLSDPDSIILDKLGENTFHKDTIASLTGLDISTVNSRLLIMELGGKVISLSGGYYAKSN